MVEDFDWFPLLLRFQTVRSPYIFGLYISEFSNTFYSLDLTFLLFWLTYLHFILFLLFPHLRRWNPRSRTGSLSRIQRWSGDRNCGRWEERKGAFALRRGKLYIGHYQLCAQLGKNKNGIYVFRNHSALEQTPYEPRMRNVWTKAGRRKECFTLVAMGNVPITSPRMYVHIFNTVNATSLVVGWNKGKRTWKIKERSCWSSRLVQRFFFCFFLFLSFFLL